MLVLCGVVVLISPDPLVLWWLVLPTDDHTVMSSFLNSHIPPSTSHEQQSTTRVKPMICTMPLRLDEVGQSHTYTCMHSRWMDSSTLPSSQSQPPKFSRTHENVKQGWNHIQLNLADVVRRAYGTTYVEALRVQVSERWWVTTVKGGHGRVCVRERGSALSFPHIPMYVDPRQLPAAARVLRRPAVRGRGAAARVPTVSEGGWWQEVSLEGGGGDEGGWFGTLNDDGINDVNRSQQQHGEGAENAMVVGAGEGADVLVERLGGAMDYTPGGGGGGD